MTSAKTGWLLGMRSVLAVLTAVGGLWGYYQSHLRLTVKITAVPLQTWSGPEVSRKLSFPDYMTTAQGGGNISPTHWPPLPPGSTLVLISVRG